MISMNTNMTSIMVRHHLNEVNDDLETNIERMSTGLRINSASDDPAGLAISEGMRADIRSIEQATQNTNDAVSMLSTAEKSMNEVHDILTRMEELAVEANTDAISSTQRENLDTEFQELRKELSDIADDTNYNDKLLLSGGFKASVQVGKEPSDMMTLSINQNFYPSGLSITGGIHISTKTKASKAETTVDTAINTVSTERAKMGAKINRLDYKVDNLEVMKQSLQASNSRIRDVDVAKESAELSQNQIQIQAANSMLTQANLVPQLALSLINGGQ